MRAAWIWGGLPLDGEITQVKESIPWVRCASGDVFLTPPLLRFFSSIFTQLWQLLGNLTSNARTSSVLVSHFFLYFCWLTIFHKIFPSKHHWLELMISTSNLCEECHLNIWLCRDFPGDLLTDNSKYATYTFHMDIDVKRTLKSVLLQCLVN